MKRMYFFFLSLVLNIFINGTSYSAQSNITACIESNDFAPYTYGSKSKWKGQGALVDLLKSFEKDLRVKFKFRILPWKRCLKYLKRNKVDAAFNASFKKERMKIGVYPFLNGKINPKRGTHSSNYVLYKRKDSPLKWSGNRFLGLKGKIGAELGFSIVSELRDLGVSVAEVNNPSVGLRKTFFDSISGFVTLESPGDYALKKLDLKFRKNIEKFSTPIKSKRYYIIFSRRLFQSKKSLVEKIWQSIEKSNKDGRTKKLIDTWIEKTQK